MWFWPVIGVLLGSLLTSLGLLDRRARRRGHVVRPGYGVYRSIREAHRDVRASQATHGLTATKGIEWTAGSRRNADTARENRRDDTGD